MSSSFTTHVPEVFRRYPVCSLASSLPSLASPRSPPMGLLAATRRLLSSALLWVREALGRATALPAELSKLFGALHSGRLLVPSSKRRPSEPSRWALAWRWPAVTVIDAPHDVSAAGPAGEAGSDYVALRSAPPSTQSTPPRQGADKSEHYESEAWSPETSPGLSPSQRNILSRTSRKFKTSNAAIRPINMRAQC
jgi:hypothetical protein